MANVARLMAMELPKDAKIARDAKVLMQEMVSEFICFITSEANDVSIAMGRKALTPDDILAAFENLESCYRSNDHNIIVARQAIAMASDASKVYKKTKIKWDAPVAL
ncbi:histone-like transcription factor [Chrysochromulina tobinii]|uniref:Histone-like transcription factor n=1 Tax=Chrysochromulina tobinii TaxID=1460289 RepID=A0A0M0JQI1_9EUKA|nr:histone-like transcription factor [Chrysochromulina tobinii]|eukprot:KOO28859.1 histone-like transcription factor [Chrysochromulina sp. CCMP291]